jgi:cyclohexanone monooxygenase
MFDVVVVGAGFGGVYMLHKLRELGFLAVGLEAGADVGGAWYWNRYPGARCDVESLVYSYSFSPEIDAEWRWTERYASQPEIQRYLAFVADRLDIRPMIRFSTRVEKAIFDEARGCWSLGTDTGETFEARYLILATGPISKPVLPDIPGIADFQGQLIHTALWPAAALDFTGKRVGVIGTGSSGVQTIPLVAEQAAHLTVFLRTRNFVVPARNHPLSEDDLAKWEAEKDEIRAGLWSGEIGGAGDVLMAKDLRQARLQPAARYTPEERQTILQRRWDWGGGVVMSSFQDVLTKPEVNDETADFLRGKIKEMVNDPELADLLTPRGYYVGTKRICVGANYYETFNRDNVEVVDVKAHPIERITAKGVVVDGREHPVDCLIFATGFDALTGAMTAMDLEGRGGLPIQEAWRHGPQTYLGLAVEGFPNMLMIGGPGSPSVLSNVAQTNEFQVDWIGRFLATLRAQGKTCFDVAQGYQESWTHHVNEVVKQSLFATCDSWYVGANIPGKPRAILAYTGGITAYRDKCESVFADGGTVDGFQAA